jgi:hypothetical protein
MLGSLVGKEGARFSSLVFFTRLVKLGKKVEFESMHPRQVNESESERQWVGLLKCETWVVGKRKCCFDQINLGGGGCAV